MSIIKIREKLIAVNTQKGFTLIELLIVMAIIAVLAGISIFALSGARSQGRDAKRKADIEVIRSALELYKADCNQYPATLPNPSSSGTPLTGNCTGTLNTYIAKIPSDPSSPTAAYRYCAGAGNRTYTISSHLEDVTATAVTACGACSPAPCRYQTSNP